MNRMNDKEGSVREVESLAEGNNDDAIQKKLLYSKRVVHNWIVRALMLKGWKKLVPCLYVKPVSPDVLIEQDNRIIADEVNIIRTTVEEDVDSALGEFFEVDFCRAHRDGGDAVLRRRLEKGRVFAQLIGKHIQEGNMRKAESTYLSVERFLNNKNSLIQLSEKHLEELRACDRLMQPYVRDTMFEAMHSALEGKDARLLVDLAGSVIWNKLEFSEVDIIFWDEICDKAILQWLRHALVDELLGAFRPDSDIGSFVRAKTNLESIGLLDKEDFLSHSKFVHLIYSEIADVIVLGIVHELFDCDIEDFVENYGKKYRIILKNFGYERMDLLDFFVEAYGWVE